MKTYWNLMLSSKWPKWSIFLWKRIEILWISSSWPKFTILTTFAMVFSHENLLTFYKFLARDQSCQSCYENVLKFYRFPARDQFSDENILKRDGFEHVTKIHNFRMKTYWNWMASSTWPKWSTLLWKRVEIWCFQASDQNWWFSYENVSKLDAFKQVTKIVNFLMKTYWNFIDFKHLTKIDNFDNLCDGIFSWKPLDIL